ncbi:hypothetical protein CISIN_1g047377mg [Citrus sinensis]|uniref:Protein kinase domain-containing protein n=1 Tax=Citrus sinensis TaxID=2711 RepID=A0A067EJ49_CITSI|nr:hypothetical protein CISIN_1g047377mg [Citrus sinensis]
MESVMSAMGIAIACLHKDPSKRPSMVDIVYALSKSDDLLSDISDDALSSSQLISGEKAIDEEGKVLWAKVEGILEGNEGRKVKRVKEWMDEILLQDSISMEGVMRAMGIAIACLHKDPSKRPSMVDIVHAVSKSDDSVSDISDDASSSSQVFARIRTILW